ncbi:MAG: DUF2238 domain-containing protein [Gemmatimonadetes bacterium]|nr:DUF2238 domain-containing protein [Gemmatimonadota bacterium]
MLAVFAGWWLLLAIDPLYRQDWFLENVLVLVAIPLLVRRHRTLPLSRRAYTGLFVFLMLHEVGAHYTYSLVPYDAAAHAVAGTSISGLLGFERNHFDRVMHLLYGVLLTPAALDLIDARTTARGGWRPLFAGTILASHAVAYEVVEWLAAEAFGGDLGAAYLGTQGDSFDAPKDMALAVAGSVIALAWFSRPRRGSSSAPRSSASASAPGASTARPRRPSSRAGRARSATTS